MSDDHTLLRSLAGDGTLTLVYARATPEQRRELNRAAYAVVSPIVFQHMTRPLELGRRHFRCAGGIQHLDSDCLDRFQDDVEAVLNDLSRNAKQPIFNIEGWVRKRLMASTVDGYRRRRGLRGAQQRPRLAKWLIEALHDDPWLKQLALEILEWVGIPTTAGTGLWPLTAWATERSRVTGDTESTTRTVAAEVELVLAAMRTRRSWYLAYIERPLSLKEAPVLPATRGSDASREPVYLSFTEDHDIDEAHINELAHMAMREIAAHLAAGNPVRSTVIRIIRETFTSGTGAEDIHRTASAGAIDVELFDRHLADPAVIDRVIAVVLTLIEGGQL